MSIKKYFSALFSKSADTGVAADIGSLRSENIKNSYTERFKKNLEEYIRKIECAETKEDALKLIADARQRVRNAIFLEMPSGVPETVCTGVAEFTDFKVEKLIIKTRENFSMTANFYLPSKFEGKIPAILLLAGHAIEGKLGATYVAAAAHYAKSGYAVLSVDPIHQGERVQSKISRHTLVNGHNLLNRQLLCVGETMAQWRVFDAIRATDYLMSRPEVDVGRIGINGNSGGGTLTAMTAACDDRFAAVAPSCYITTFYHNAANELPIDGEQVPHGLIANGGEMIDFILANAPKPYCILSQQQDFFDLRGARETYRMAKKIYTLLGCPENITMVEGPQPHGYSIELRNGAYKFFSKNFNMVYAEEKNGESMPEFKDLRCLEFDSVSELPNEYSVQDFIAEKVAKCKSEREKINLSDTELKTKLCTVLKIPEKTPIPDYRLFQPVMSGKKTFAEIGLETDKNIFVSLYCRGYKYGIFPSEKVELYLPETDALVELHDLEASDKDAQLWGFDYRGIGSSMSRGGLYAPYDIDYFLASNGVIFDEPFIGRRVYDILQAVRILHEKGACSITLRAKGISMIPAVFAAVLSEVPVKAVLIGDVPTFGGHALSVEAPVPQSFVPFDILKLTDIDELTERFPEKFEMR